MTAPEIYGVDFSGAADAGRRIWIAEATARDGFLSVRACYAARDLPGSGVARAPALWALRTFIASRPGAIFGIDVPFGLPAPVVDERTWLAFVESFVGRYAGAEQFKAEAWDKAGARELRRRTDVEARTPFCAYNLRLYKQTFRGLKDVIGPLVLDDEARALPMQERSDGAATLVEVCPASTLSRHGVDEPYKGRERAGARARLVDWLVSATPMAIPAVTRTRAVEEPNGDALDALIAVTAAWRASGAAPSSDPQHRLEGYVYL